VLHFLEHSASRGVTTRAHLRSVFDRGTSSTSLLARTMSAERVSAGHQVRGRPACEVN